MPKESKSDKITYEHRISRVNDFLCSGKTAEEIWLFVNNKNAMLKAFDAPIWDVSIDMVYKYVQKCYSNWAEYLKKERLTRLEGYIAKKDFLYEMAISKGLVKEANEVLDSKAKIEGIWVDKVSFTNSEGNDINNIEIKIQKREDIPNE